MKACHMPDYPIRLEIITPEETIVSTDVCKVFLPGTIGPFEVLKDHAPIISSLEAGTITYESADGENSIAIRSGFAEVRNNKVEVCAEI